jgi:hypothetical protein
MVDLHGQWSEGMLKKPIAAAMDTGGTASLLCHHSAKHTRLTGDQTLWLPYM